jgi:hypothetical protein
METALGVLLILFLIGCFGYGIFSIIDYAIGKKFRGKGTIVGGRMEERHTDADGNYISDRFYLSIKVNGRQIELEVDERFYYNHTACVGVKFVVGKISGLFYLPTIIHKY